MRLPRTDRNFKSVSRNVTRALHKCKPAPAGVREPDGGLGPRRRVQNPSFVRIFPTFLTKLGFPGPGIAGSGASIGQCDQIGPPPGGTRVELMFARFTPAFAPRFLPNLSVRARIAVLALIPVVGFIANGVTYTSNEGEVAQAFDTVKNLSDLTDASRDFKGALTLMRTSANEFVARPNQDQIKAFRDAHGLAVKSLDAIEASVSDEERKGIEELRKKLAGMKSNFAGLNTEQENLGFTESDGIRHRMIEAAAAVERIINEDMSWLSAEDSGKLLLSLLKMRHFEAEYRLSQSQTNRQFFVTEFNNFNKIFDGVIAAAIMKEQLSQQVKVYADTFEEWIASTNKLHPMLAL